MHMHYKTQQWAAAMGMALAYTRAYIVRSIIRSGWLLLGLFGVGGFDVPAVYVVAPRTLTKEINSAWRTSQIIFVPPNASAHEVEIVTKISERERLKDMLIIYPSESSKPGIIVEAVPKTLAGKS